MGGHDERVMKTHICFWWACLTSLSSLVAQENPALVKGTVTLPYETLRSLDQDKQETPRKKIEQATLLQSSHYRIDLSKTPAAISVSFRVQHFSEDIATTALLTSDVSVSELKPADMPLLVKQDLLQMITEKPGKYEVNLQMTSSQANAFTALPCASASVTLEGLAEGECIEWRMDGNTQLLTANAVIGIPARGTTISWKHLRGQQAKALSQPEQASEWLWRHEVTVKELEGVLFYQSFSQAETTAGDTSRASIALPAGVSNIEAASEDLEDQTLQRDADGTQRLLMRWKGERQLTREVVLSYQKRVSNLQDSWNLEAPGGENATKDQSQFFLADQAQRKFTGERVRGPFAPETLRKSLQSALSGQAYLIVESQQGIGLIRQELMPIASTADAVIVKARWDTRMELDGATLTTGNLEVQYRTGARLALRLPENAVLLSCNALGQEIAPVVTEKGGFAISLPVGEKMLSTTPLSISYTQRMEKFGPLEGKFSIALPYISYFINSLQWQVSLPIEYAAEVAGNLTRPMVITNKPNIILLEKNLCRDETPQAEIFYNRNNSINR